MITDDGSWAEFRVTPEVTRGRPCLFLDRDGVLIEDTGYPHRPEDVVLVPESLALVHHANQSGYVVGVVSNQSGIGRGLFDWPAFQAVQGVIEAALATIPARLDFVLASPHHADSNIPLYRAEAHPWRKPGPGMLLAAARALELDLARSVMVGDRLSDMRAGARAGLSHCLLLGDMPVEGLDTSYRHVSRATLRETFETLTTL